MLRLCTFLLHYPITIIFYSYDITPLHKQTPCTCTHINVPLVKASDSLGHLGVGGCRGCFPLLGYLVEGIHIRLMGGHFLLESLKIRRKGVREGERRKEIERGTRAEDTVNVQN